MKKHEGLLAALVFVLISVSSWPSIAVQPQCLSFWNNWVLTEPLDQSRSVWKVSIGGANYVLRFPSWKHDLTFEKFCSLVSERIAPGRNSKVSFLSQNFRKKILAELARHQTQGNLALSKLLTENPLVSVTNYLSATEKKPQIRLDVILKSRDPLKEALSQMPETVLREISESWVARVILGENDMNDSNWVIFNGHAVGIDLAASPAFSTERAISNDPLNIGKEHAAIKDAIYLNSLREEFVSRLQQLNGVLISHAASASGYPIDDSEIARILERRDRVLKRIETQRRGLTP